MLPGTPGAHLTRLLLALCLLAPLGAQAHLRGSVTLVGTRFGPRGPFGIAGAVLLAGEKELVRGVTVYGSAPLSLVWNGSALGFQDLGTHLGVLWSPRSWASDEGVSLELYVNNLVRVRPAFDWANFWGSGWSRSVAPIARLGFSRRRVELWAALQGRASYNPLTLDEEVLPSAYFGGGLRLPAGLRLSARGAVIDRGLSPPLASQGVRLPLVAGGGSAQLRWDFNDAVGPMFELLRYPADPERYDRFFATEQWGTPLAFTALLEGGLMTQTLESVDVFAAAKQVTTGYFDAQARLRAGPIRGFLTARVHPLDFLVFDGPGLVPYRAWQEGTALGARLQLVAGVDGNIPVVGIVAGVSLTVERPAFAFTPTIMPISNNPPLGVFGARYLVFLARDTYSLLPEGQAPEVIWRTRFSARYGLLSTLFVAFELEWEHDPNRITWVDDAAGVAQPARDAAGMNLVHLLLAIQARI